MDKRLKISQKQTKMKALYKMIVCKLKQWVEVGKTYSRTFIGKINTCSHIWYHQGEDVRIVPHFQDFICTDNVITQWKQKKEKRSDVFGRRGKKRNASSFGYNRSETSLSLNERHQPDTRCTDLQLKANRKCTCPWESWQHYPRKGANSSTPSMQEDH